MINRLMTQVTMLILFQKILLAMSWKMSMTNQCVNNERHAFHKTQNIGDILPIGL